MERAKRATKTNKRSERSERAQLCFSKRGRNTPDFILLSKTGDPKLLHSEFFEQALYFIKVFVCVKHEILN